MRLFGKRKKKKGFTMIEVLVALAISIGLIASVTVAFVTVKNSNLVARHRLQAMAIVRAEVERLKALPPEKIEEYTRTVTLDAGQDAVMGTTDDLTGTLSVKFVGAATSEGGPFVALPYKDGYMLAMVATEAITGGQTSQKVEVALTWVEGGKSYKVSEFFDVHIEMGDLLVASAA